MHFDIMFSTSTNTKPSETIVTYEFYFQDILHWLETKTHEKIVDCNFME